MNDWWYKNLCKNAFMAYYSQNYAGILGSALYNIMQPQNVIMRKSISEHNKLKGQGSINNAGLATVTHMHVHD